MTVRSPSARSITLMALNAWIVDFVERRRKAPRRADVVDAAMYAEIEGRPMTEVETIGLITL
jgi:cytochrome P450